MLDENRHDAAVSVLISDVMWRSANLLRRSVSHAMSSRICLTFVSLSWKVSGVGALDAQGGGV
jgi:hypothetical protein